MLLSVLKVLLSLGQRTRANSQARVASGENFSSALHTAGLQQEKPGCAREFPICNRVPGASEFQKRFAYSFSSGLCYCS